MQFKRVKNLSAWKKFSIALWPSEAIRFCKVELDLTPLKKLKTENQVSWSTVLVCVLTQTIRENPLFNQFIRRYNHYTRENIDFFLRITLDDQKNSAESDSLWGMYLRGCEKNSMNEIQERIQVARLKFSTKENRFPLLQKVFSEMPGIFSMLLVKMLTFCIRMGFPIPGISKLCFPTVSMSNTGSIQSPLTQPLISPLTNAPITVNWGTIVEKDGKITVEAFFGFDHRVFDGQDVRVFFESLNQIISSGN